LLSDIRFSSQSEPGLEFVDILTNAVRRMLTGNLQKEGWKNIHRLMIHRQDETYISFILFGEDKEITRRASYARRVHEGFVNGGRLMMTRRNKEIASQDIAFSQRTKGIN